MGRDRTERILRYSWTPDDSVKQTQAAMQERRQQWLKTSR